MSNFGKETLGWKIVTKTLSGYFGGNKRWSLLKQSGFDLAGQALGWVEAEARVCVRRNDR